MNKYALNTNDVRVDLESLLAQQQQNLTGAPDHATAAGDAAVSLPFLNLDPYTVDDDAPLTFTLDSPDPDYINWELGGTPDQLEHDLGVSNATMRSDDAIIHVENLSETRVTEIQYGHFNGEKTPLQWHSGLSHEVSGTIDFQNSGPLYIQANVESFESVAAERFSVNENGEVVQDLSEYAWGMGMGFDGSAHACGIDTFSMEFTTEISLVWDAELGFYHADVLVELSYTIEYLDGRIAEGEAFQEETGFWSDLDLFSFNFNNDVLSKLAGFERDMGDAFHAIESYSNHMDALLLHLKDEGYYDLYDSMGGGIDNPFDFDLPSIDPFA